MVNVRVRRLMYTMLVLGALAMTGDSSEFASSSSSSSESWYYGDESMQQGEATEIEQPTVPHSSSWFLVDAITGSAESDSGSASYYSFADDSSGNDFEIELPEQGSASWSSALQPDSHSWSDELDAASLEAAIDYRHRIQSASESQSGSGSWASIDDQGRHGGDGSESSVSSSSFDLGEGEGSGGVEEIELPVGSSSSLDGSGSFEEVAIGDVSSASSASWSSS
eukprot:SAG31_NODE_7330_length_1717_cov_2.583436_2_plen_223_part_01